MMGNRRTATPRPTSALRFRSAWLPGLLGFALALAAPALLRAVTVDQLPSPLPAHWVLDTTGTLSATDIALIDAKAEAARQRSGGDVAVVLIDTTDGRPHRAFATELANRWKLGGEEGRNAILILVAKADRKAEMALSKGIDDTTGTAAAEVVMNVEMTPRFKGGDLLGGLLAGLDAVADRILAPAGGLAPAPLAAAPEPLSPTPAPALEPVDAPHRQDPRSPWPILSWLGAALASTGGLVYLARRPLKCKACKVKMVKLDETQEDPYLEEGQQTEESIRSMDYDVWVCTLCQAVKVREHSIFGSGYRKCSKCRFKTARIEEEVLSHPTEYQAGQVRMTEICQRCQVVKTWIHTLPRLDPPRRDYDDDRSSSSGSSRSAFSSGNSFSSGSSSSSSSRSSSGGSSSSSSSSGGGSNFSGGGASGSW